MKISNGHPYLGFKNLIFCITADVHPTDVLMTLAERQYIDVINLKKQKPQVGEVIIIENKNRKLIALTIKPYLDTNNLKSDMDKCLKVLSKLINKFEIKEIEIIRDLDMMTQLQVFKFIEAFNSLCCENV